MCEAQSTPRGVLADHALLFRNFGQLQRTRLPAGSLIDRNFEEFLLLRREHPPGGRGAAAPDRWRQEWDRPTSTATGRPASRPCGFQNAIAAR
jgi:hypothetical protein